MDSAGHRASQDLNSLPLWVDSPGTGSLPLGGLRRFLNRSTSTASLDTINTLLPQYSERTISALWGDDLGAHRETIHSQTNENNIGTLAGGASHSANSNPRVSVVSVPPRYSFVPPRYSHLFSIPTQQVAAEGVSRAEHTYSICSGLKNKPWATLRVCSQPPLGASPKHQKFPRFSSGDMIAGLIEFTLDSPQTVNSIIVSVRGRVIRGYLAEESDTFLDHQVTIWTRADGDPRSPTPGSTKKFDGRLKGMYQFPFVFPFPTHVDISTSTPFLPPSLQTSSDSMSTSSSSPATATTSSSFPPITMPPSSRLRSLSSPVNATYFSGSKNPSSVPAPLSTNETPRNEVNSFPVTNSPEESEKARLKRAAEEQDQPRAQLEDNSLLNSLPAHVFSIPQTFLERGIHANVQYELGLHIAHGLLRPASKLNTTIVYTPSITPPLASVARQRAYSEHAPLPGPVQDPDGWQTLPKVTVSGILLGQQKVDVECTLSLAKPLCYTRGTIIPCYLTFKSSNSHALSLLLTPKSPFVRLTRRVRYAQYSSPTTENASNEPSTSGDSPAGFSASLSRVKQINIGGAKRGDAKEVDEVQLAVWWVPPKDAPQDMYLKTLEGEIHLAKELQPTCRFPSFSVEYAVEMLPLASSIFVPACSDGEQCLLVQPVEIATCYAEEGPVPCAFTKPMSDREREKRKEREPEKEQVEIVMQVQYCHRGN